MAKFVIILVSILVILVISALGALPCLFWNMGIRNYLAWFFIITAAQLTIGKMWNYSVDRKIRLQMEKVNAAKTIANSFQYIEIRCAYCSTANMAKLLVGKENKFVCEACKETNAVILNTSSARITQPIMPKAEVAEIFKSLDG